MIFITKGMLRIASIGHEADADITFSISELGILVPLVQFIADFGRALIVFLFDGSF